MFYKEGDLCYFYPEEVDGDFVKDQEGNEWPIEVTFEDVEFITTNDGQSHIIDWG